jgi:hypothetical protein
VKKLAYIAAALPLLAFAAPAQDNVQYRMLEDQTKALQMKMQTIGAVKGIPVKGAPYSGEEVNENSHMLADGTRIHNETHVNVYRDSEGRTRRESPESIIVSDPVAGATYILNPKTMTGQKLNMVGSTFSFMRTGSATTSSSLAPGENAATFTVKMESDGGSPIVTVNGKTLDPKTVQELIATAKANGGQAMTVDGVTLNPLLFDQVKVGAAMGAKKKAEAAAIAGVGPMTAAKLGLASESLGTQNFDGVPADGTRTTNTIETGAIGNDRPIQVVNERWYSTDLQTVVMTKHSDPRSGEETFRLINIRRGDPGAYLFQLPTGYTISEPHLPTVQPLSKQ